MRKRAYAIREQQMRRSACAFAQSDQCSAFIVRCLVSIISLLIIVEISRPYLVPSAEQAGLWLTLSQIPKTGFLVTWPIYWTLSTYEPAHDKTKKMTVRPAKTQISLGSHPV